MTEVRTRFAPSPTGYMHMGNLRTALYTYLIAKSQDGTFILRIEDTDQERYVEGALQFIYDTLRLTGLDYDEGPDKGGDFGPYIQSQRRDTYRKFALQLVDSGHAYPCFCTKDRLDALREEMQARGEMFRYDHKCRDLSKEEAAARMASGEAYVIRQKMPTSGKTTFHDVVFGDISVPNDELEDQILLKTDGLPTYNFANVVDDHLMGITHVVRGTEYLSSAPKYNLLYKAFGWEVPLYVHTTPIMKSQTQKLSKRYGDASFNDFYEKGYLKEAIINYLALLGWSPGTDQEIFSLDELKQVFSLSGLSKSPAIFDPVKLRWMNGVYIRNLDAKTFYRHALPYMQQVLAPTAIDLNELAALLQSRTEVFNEIPDMIAFLAHLPQFDVNLFKHKKTKTDLPAALVSLRACYQALAEIEVWEKEQLEKTLKDLKKEMAVKTARVFWPLRIAISGQTSTPGGVYDIALLLGKEEILKRIASGIDLLEEAINDSE